MRIVLDALKEGRLIELPVNDKNKVLEYLAILIEAIPDIGAGSDIVKDVLEREAVANTGLGMGIACPHARSKKEGELLCAIGWSPSGIDYGSPDGKKVQLVFMFYIPDSQRNLYLKEISSLAKAVQEESGIEKIEKLKDLQKVRDRLLDWIEISMAKAAPISKARMIKLEAKELVVGVPAVEPERARRAVLVAFTLVALSNEKRIVLSRDSAFCEAAESSPELLRLISTHEESEWNGYQIYVNSSKQFSMNRVLYECLAVK